MDIEDLRRESIRCRNLGTKDSITAEGAWYRDRGLRLAEAAEAMAAQALAGAPRAAAAAQAVAAAEVPAPA